MIKYMSLIVLLVSSVFLGTSGFAYAESLASNKATEDLDDLLEDLPEGTSVWGDASPLDEVEPVSNDRYTIRHVDVTDRPYSKALQIELPAQAKGIFSVPVKMPFQYEVDEGDVMLLAFDMRTLRSEDESSLGSVQSQVRIDPEEMPADMAKLYSADSDWKTFFMPFEALRSSKNDQESLANLFFGFKAQTVEVANVRLLHYGDRVALDDLPVMKTTYPGMEEGASWREEADERIDDIRKADIKVTVKDEKGKPLRHANVDIEQQRHAFGFGGSFTASKIYGPRATVTPSEKQDYLNTFKRTFNKAVFPNELKWKHYDNLGVESVPMALDWLDRKQIPVRGHALIWAHWKRVPEELKEQLEDDPEKLREVTNDHVTEYVDRWRGRVPEWDVLNEPYSQHEFMDIAGEDIMIDWFESARAADPNAKLYVNDYAILAGRDYAHQDSYYDTIEYLIDNGAPLDGIGMQSHFKSITEPEEILRRLDRFATFGKDIQMTEFTIQENDPVAKEQFTRDFLTTAFSHPSVNGVVTWSFWDKFNDDGLYTKDWTLTPNGKAWMDMIYNEWWTDESVKSDKEGSVETRGFLGDYHMTVTYKGIEERLSFNLAEDGEEIEVIIDRKSRS
ncbi:hypothetical protein G4V62_10895 [Bacillaceae bacterium SIJ1]|uniref:endo-1,4-beta-xylanase n=1 Tax=Litoribacterium kuwaitense TaxID=1398745 RepID=UPI0013EB977E|nr:endo-1,4-beta-xylanase [Litoribacterium kuwaitense]NGP45439.1 hypothetical protein [Litoribacterium kuwaitense]